MKRFVLLIVLLGCFSATATAFDWWEDEQVEEESQVSLEIKAWINRMRGDITWGGSGQPGSSIDLREDLGLGSSSFAPYIDLSVGLSENWRVRFHFWRAIDDRATELPRDINFGGVTFPQGTPTTTDFSFSTYSALFDYRFINGPQIDVRAIFGVSLFRARMEMFSETDAQLDVTRQASIPAPQLGIGVDIELVKNLVLRGHIIGMYSNYSRLDGYQADVEAGVVWTIQEGFELIAGYKVFRASVDFNKRNRTDQADFTIEGPFVGFGFRF